MTKICCHCKVPKDYSEFSKKKTAKDGLQSRCNQCMKITMLKVYGLDKSGWNEKSKIQKGRKREWINEIKIARGCLCCEEIDFSCLEFHHADPSEKEDTVSNMAADKASDSRIREEIEKCLVLCANCHRKVHTGSILMIVEK